MSLPAYNPDTLHDDTRFNVLELADPHVFEKSGVARTIYQQDIADQVNRYAEAYGIDRVDVMGDVGSLDDVFGLLENLDADEIDEVFIVAGDEDRHTAAMAERGDYRWFTQTDSDQPWDVDVDYRIFDEGFTDRIHGLDVQVAHHPHRSDRDSFSDRFSIDWIGNEFLYSNQTPSLEEPDMVKYGHSHAEYTRPVHGTIAKGCGGYYVNHNSLEEMPKGSLGLTSFGHGTVDTLHFDRFRDEVFEHRQFDFEGGLTMEELRGPGLDVQERFVKALVPEAAHEDLESYEENLTRAEERFDPWEKEFRALDALNGSDVSSAVSAQD